MTGIALQPDQRHCSGCQAVIKRRSEWCKYCRKRFSSKEFLEANPWTEADRKLLRRFVKVVGVVFLVLCAFVFIANVTGLAKYKSASDEHASNCRNPWDGSVYAVVNAVKDQMKDPGSFEHIETRIGAVNRGSNDVVMTYRGRNGFGGMAIETSVVRIDNSDCSVTR